MFHSIILKVRRLDDSGAWSTGIHQWLGLMGHDGVVRVVYQNEATSVYLYCVYTRAITVRCGTRVFTLFRAIPYSKGWSAGETTRGTHARANSNELRTPALAPSWMCSSCLYLSGPARNDVLFLLASLHAEHVEFTDFGS